MALPTEDLVRYTPGQVAVGGGVLQDATMANFSYKNNAKLVHTLRNSPNGIVIGVKEATGTIETEVPDQGPERSYFADVASGKTVKFQYEIPTLNIEIEGVYTELAGEIRIGDTVKLTLNWTGKLKAPVAV